MKLPFVYTLDDDYDTGERVDIILSKVELPEGVDYEDVYWKIRSQGLWYQINLRCTLDTDTGIIEIEHVEL